MGITTPIQNDLTIALGSSGVKLSELTTAYGILANNGIKVKPYSVEQVITSTGRVVYTAKQQQEKVLDIYTAATMTRMLTEVVNHGTARAIIMKDREIAGKTGTTDNYRDACIVAYTPEIVTGVWVGNDNNKPHRNVTGGTLPAQIWANYMKVALSDIPPSKFNYPEIDIEPLRYIKQQDKDEVPTEESDEENANEQNITPDSNADTKLDVPLPIDPKQNNSEKDNDGDKKKKTLKEKLFDSSKKVQDISSEQGNTSSESAKQAPLPVPAPVE